ncbi:MAG: YdbL family protein [Desulfatibacillaceae bacterium]|nr:YdbL family protein [Desulfatibacillaceae bacterium]
MKKPSVFQTALFALLVFAGACVTVNIYFPAAQVQKAAEQIVDEVYQGGVLPDVQTGKIAPVLKRFLALVGPASAHAQDSQAATSVSNASIRVEKDIITANHEQLKPHYQSGAVGIQNDGYITVRSTQGLAIRDVATLRRLVDADNQARKRLYAAVAQALEIEPGELDKVAAIFADQWREKAPSGWWIQDGQGNWSAKP